MYYSKLRTIICCIILFFPLFAPFNALIAADEVSISSPTELRFERHDPPFFRIELPDGKLVYILGALHSIPVNIALSAPTLGELERIAKTQIPILLTEHSATNAVNLGNMEKAKIGMGDSWMNESKRKEHIPMAGLQQLLKLAKDKIFIDMDHQSNVEIGTLLTLDPWLAAPILQMHIGVLYKRKFGGFEHDLENAELWKPHWKAIRFLEDHETLLGIAQQNAAKDYDENLKWINNSIRLSLIISNYDEDTHARGAINHERIRDIGYYSWEHIKDEQRYETSIARNRTWVPKVHHELTGPDNAILLVMGTAHLSGQENFLSLLLKSLSPSSVLMRFSNTEGWIRFEYKH